jgi:hypothetical protein
MEFRSAGQFVHDPDGNNVEAVCHDRESSPPLPENTS